MSMSHRDASPSTEVIREKEGLDAEIGLEVIPANPTNTELLSAIAVGEYPDGGLQAWLNVLGAMCTTFTTFGFVNSWGVFQSYYQQNILSSSSPSDIAWIGSVQYALIFLPGLVSGRLFDLGYARPLFLTCSAVLILATFLTAECTQYWHFLLCQGFLVGLACGGFISPTAAVLAHWFKKKRGIAMGWMAIGTSFGGTIIPIAARRLIVLVGFPWTMRIIGFIHIIMLTFANLLLKRRLPPINVSGGLFNWRAFKSAPFSVYCASTFTTFLGIYTVLTYIDISAAAVGVSEDFSFYLVSIANASSGFGRYVGGKGADLIGPINISIPFTFIAGILTFAWPFAKTQGSLVAIAILYGFASGTYVALVSNPVMEFGDTQDVGRRVGMMMSILAIGAVIGTPISGAINSATGDFTGTGYYAGSAIIAGVGLLCLCRQLALGRFLGRI